jgi:hypothetical protein
VRLLRGSPLCSFVRMWSRAKWLGSLLLVTGCTTAETGNPSGSGGGAAAPANPVGTIVSNLLAQGNGPDSINFTTGTVSTPAINGAPVLCESAGQNDLSLDDAANFHACGGSIAYLGPVSGLGAVTEVPTAGFVTSTSALIGGGYVVKTVENNVYRLYVARALLAAGGGSLGVEIQWTALGPVCQPLFTRCPDGTCVNTRTDVNNCGGCGIVCPGAGAECEDLGGNIACVGKNP